jgi:glutathione S-transferase
MITLYGRRSSINVQKVLWTLGELALPFRHVDLGGAAGGLDTPAFRAMNPHGRIPVIEDGGVHVWESNAIVRYLCAAYADGGLSPSGALDRALCDEWMEWASTALQPAVMGLFWGFYRTPVAQRNGAANAQLAAQSAELLRRLDRWLADRPYVAGEALSMADLPAGTLMHRCYTMGVELPEGPALAAWRGRLAERPAYRDTIMQPFDELFGRLAF